MIYVVTESCIKRKYTHCCAVFPTDALCDGPNCVAIDPDDCIDCTLCVVESPVDAMFAEDDVPKSQMRFIQAADITVFKTTTIPSPKISYA